MTEVILQDVSPNGKRRPWPRHRKAADKLAEPYEAINPDKARRLRNCAIMVTRETYADESFKDFAELCHVRLCPICTWRRSLKVEAQMFQIMEAIETDKPHAYLFLTLTVKNCEPDRLNDEITRVLQAFNAMTRLSAYKNAVKGYFRTLEVTHNLDNDTYHPHIHAILAVNPSYFTDNSYLSQAKWTDMWQKCLKVSYTPIVNIKRVNGNTAGAVAEVAKYSVKSEDILIPDDWELTIATVRILDAALHKRRMLSYGGIFREYHKKLNLTDPDNPDEEPATEEPVSRTHYIWCSFYGQYRKTDISQPGPDRI